jgi:hypothetical protein
MRKTIILSAIAAAVLGGATLAEARDSRVACTSTPASQWLSTSELSAKFAAQGYTVRKIELKRGCGEADLVDRNGVRTDVRFDPTNGAIMTRQAEVAHQPGQHRDDRQYRNHRDQPHSRRHDDRR